MRVFLLSWLLLLAAPASAWEARGQGRGWFGAGVDTNAPRDFVSPGLRTEADGLLFAVVNLEGLLRFERGRVTGTYDLGARKFTFLGAEDTLVQNAQVEALWPVARALTLGLAARARDRRGADRDYTDLVGEAVLGWSPDEALDVRLQGGAHRFLFRPRFETSFFGPEASLSVRYRFNRRHSLSAYGNFSPRSYNGEAHPNPSAEAPPFPAPVRADTVVSVGASYSWKGPVHLTVGYTYLEQASNSFGESLGRHRISLTAGVRLGWRFTLLASAVQQFTAYPDGVYLSPDLQVAEDEENSSSMTVKLVRPLSESIDLDLRYAGYRNTMPSGNFLYVRQVFSIGIGVNF